MDRLFLLTSILVVTLGPVGVRAEMARRILPPDEPVFYDQAPEPKEIKDLAASPGRVFAIADLWSGGYDYFQVYYQCDAASLNRLIDRYASLNDPALDKGASCVIVRDRADQERKSLEESLNEHLESRARTAQNPKHQKWLLEQRWHVPAFNCLLRIDSQYLGSMEVPAPAPENRIRVAGFGPGNLRVKVILEIWVNDQVTLRDLKIPQNLRVKSAGRIEKFVDAHEAIRLGSREAVLEQRIADMQGELARLRRYTATTKPATTPRR